MYGGWTFYPFPTFSVGWDWCSKIAFVANDSHHNVPTIQLPDRDETNWQVLV
jgi:hypothetical protein